MTTATAMDAGYAGARPANAARRFAAVRHAYAGLTLPAAGAPPIR